MSTISIREGWNDALHLQLLQTAASSLAEMGIISDSVMKEISDLIGEFSK